MDMVYGICAPVMGPDDWCRNYPSCDIFLETGMAKYKHEEESAGLWWSTWLPGKFEPQKR